ncbi:hypothetical protein GN244_ATG13286 [Phytophthora infestans]|uniref:Uncharacterized protein n=1 Tax=Phytophthora infestans TaxID=4787 RepID=A0A833SLA1_PHYIN|nr:hypothetical protein GN244_ATG13286 [Phytophthora infestans]KAF4133037.1 hypothetical protein GN958_ATG17793 [Phytophthora infestans]
MGNKLASSGEQRVSRVSIFNKPRRRSQSPGGFGNLMSPSSPSLQQPSHHKHKRRSRSQSEGVTSDCGTAVSTTDSQLPRGSNSFDKAMTPSLPLDPTTEEEELSKSSSKVSEKVADQARRIHEAEKILLEIAKEYAAKRAAGLVPTKPVPARTLLWEEMERRSQRVRAGVGRRGSCLFGRDSEEGPCGCASYKKMKKLPDGRENTGGVCECCKHGAPWHRLAGGTMTATGSGVMGMRSSMRSRRTSSRNSRSGSAPQQAPIESSLYSLGSDYYDEYDDEYDEDESDEDDEDIANEVARPYGMMDDPTPPLVHTPARSEGDALDRSSLFSNGDSFGLPPRLSSTSRHLDKLLGAIAKYRAMGLSKDEIEIKIREDFPPTERLSYSANTPRRTRSSG